MPDTHSSPAPAAQAAPTAPPPRSSRPVRPVTAAVLLALVILLWGVNWPVMKVGVQLIPPLTFSCLRLFLGAITLFGVAAMAGQLRLPSRHDLPIVISVGLLQMAGFLLCIGIALQYVPAGRSAILAYTTPLWVVPLALAFLGERLNRLKILGLALGLGGVAVLFNPAAFDWTDDAVLLGNGLLMLGALLWAVNIVQVRGHRWEGTPLSLGPWQMLVGATALLPAAVWADWGRPIVWGTDLALVVAYNGPIATAFCFWALVSVNRALPAITTSLGTLGTPVVGLLASAWLLGERVTATNLGGLGLIAAGLVMVLLAERRKG